MAYSNFSIAVGIYLKDARNKKGLTQTDVGVQAGHTKSWYVDIERGKNNVYFDDVQRLCTILDIDIKKLAEFATSYKKST
jgi:transcriptional regulator with XRE-family HTH domain